MSDKHDLVDDIIRWEDGDMTEQEELEFFTLLRDAGLLSKLQGCYGRRAHQLGLI